MSTRTPSEVSRLWFGEMWNNRDTALLRELIAPDAVGILEGGQTITGPDGFITFQKAFIDAVPDLKVEPVRSITQGDEVCIHWKASGQHCGAGLGCAPSNKQIEFQGVTWLTVKNGRVVAGRDFWNLGGLMQYLSAT